MAVIVVVRRIRRGSRLRNYVGKDAGADDAQQFGLVENDLLAVALFRLELLAGNIG